MSQPYTHLLSDEQVQLFITDGMIELQSELSDEFHATVTAELDHALKKEMRWLGDNLVPRIPLLQEFLDSPVLNGALKSILGPDFSWAPHRFPHNSEPLPEDVELGEIDAFENQPVMGKGSISGSGWHQDGHSKGARSRWHTFRAINVFYFPHDTPIEMGPTRVLAGSHLYATLNHIVPEQVVFKPRKAGSFIVAAFDLGHAGTPNQTRQSRYMLKFVALRMKNPSEPVWNHVNDEWRTPPDRLTTDNLPTTWLSLWNWICGKSRQENISTPSSKAIREDLPRLASKNHLERLEAMYRLSASTQEDIPLLVDYFLGCAGKGRHESPPPEDRGYYAMAKDPLLRQFTKRQFVPEDLAIVLGAVGLPALDVLVELLTHEDPWIRMNAAYAISEIGCEVPSEIADRVGMLLDEPLDCVVRAALDALCSLNNYTEVTVTRLHRLLTESPDDWQYAAMGEKKLGGNWTIQNQVRYVAAWALRTRVIGSSVPDGIEQALIDALEENTGYTPAVACEALEILNTPAGLRAVIKYLSTRRWDPSSFAPIPRRQVALKVA